MNNKASASDTILQNTKNLERKTRIPNSAFECVRALYYTATGANRDVDEECLPIVALERLVDLVAATDESRLGVLSARPFEVGNGVSRLRGIADLVFVDEAGPCLVSIVIPMYSGLGNQERMANLAAYALGSKRWSICEVDLQYPSQIKEKREPVNGDQIEREFQMLTAVDQYIAEGKCPTIEVSAKRGEDFGDCLPEICSNCPFRTVCERDK